MIACVSILPILSVVIIDGFGSPTDFCHVLHSGDCVFRVSRELLSGSILLPHDEELNIIDR